MSRLGVIDGVAGGAWEQSSHQVWDALRRMQTELDSQSQQLEQIIKGNTQIIDIDSAGGWCIIESDTEPPIPDAPCIWLKRVAASAPLPVLYEFRTNPRNPATGTRDAWKKTITIS